MKKVLIICHDYPPFPSVGSWRPYSWFKNFKTFGLEPILITRKWNEGTGKLQYNMPDEGLLEKTVSDEGTLIRVPYNGGLKHKLFGKINVPGVLRRSITLLGIILKWNLPFFDDKYFLYKESSSYLENNDCDLILVTGEPFILFKYASDLSKKYGIPWAADYRDGWSVDHGEYSLLMKILRMRERRIERGMLESISFYSVAADYIHVMMMEKFHGLNIKNKCFEHPNGVDLGILNWLKKDLVKYNDFTITYTGSIYEKHDVVNFLNAFEKIIKQPKYTRVKLRFVGIDLKPNHLTGIIHEYSKRFPENISIIPAVSNKDAVKEQLKSHILLKFDFTGQANGMLGAKIFEYAATKVPILTVLSINNKSTSFFPNRTIQKLVYGIDEIYQTIQDSYRSFIEKGDCLSDITDEEIYSISKQYYIKEMVEYIKEKLD